MNTQKVSAWNVIKMAGAWISFCIGSAFATGTGIMQVYGSHGKMGYAIFPVAILLNLYLAVSFISLGFSGKVEPGNSMAMFEYYCGPWLGKVFRVMTVVFMLLSPTCMVSGFGASLNQFFGVPTWIGCVIMGIACFVTVILGLKKLVNVVGTVGPVIIIISILIGLVSIMQNHGGLAEGLALSAGADIVKYNDSWFISGLLEAAWAPLILGPFLISCCETINSRKEGLLGSVTGVIGQYIATAIMLTAYFCQFKEVSQNMLPTLYIVRQISAGLAGIFLIILFLGVYSSAVPSQFNFCANFFKENTRNYRILAFFSVFVAVCLSLVLPFDLLLNRIYVFFSYASWIFIVAMMVRQVRDFLGKKKEKGEP